MRMNAAVVSLVATVLLASLGFGRAIAQDEHDHQHQSSPTGSSDQAAKSTTSKSSAQLQEAPTHEGTMDMKAMCDMHRQMMSKASPADRKAMADREMKGMSEKQKQQHMKMMDETCK